MELVLQWFYLNKFVFHFVIEVAVQTLVMYQMAECRDELTNHFDNRAVL